MSLIIFNGSPRGQKSNSNVITGWFTQGYEADDVYYLNKIKQHQQYITLSKEVHEFLFVFPLYADAMPGQVKMFFENMYRNKEVYAHKRISFIIHSGFSEAIHSKNLESYLISFAKLMEMDFKGLIMIPGSEGFKIMPDQMTKKKKEKVIILARAMKAGQSMDEKVLRSLQGPLVKPAGIRFIFRLLGKTGLLNFYWNSQLKDNNAYGRRYDKPYAKS